MPKQLQNNYPNLKNDFKSDTGLDADKHISEYLLYYNARMTDRTSQIVSLIATYLGNNQNFKPE